MIIEFGPEDALILLEYPFYRPGRFRSTPKPRLLTRYALHSQLAPGALSQRPRIPVAYR
jgi:hypothetical protein